MLFTRLCHIDQNSQLISRNFNTQKQLTIKDAIHLTDEVWTTLKPETIMKVWNRTIFKPIPNEPETAENVDEDDVLLSEIQDLLRKLPGQENVECADIQEWCSIDKDLVCF